MSGQHVVKSQITILKSPLRLYNGNYLKKQSCPQTLSESLQIDLASASILNEPILSHTKTKRYFPFISVCVSFTSILVVKTFVAQTVYIQY